MSAAVHSLGPGTRWQDADYARARSGPAAVRGRSLGQPDKIPAGTPSRLGLLHGAPRLAAVERNRGHPDRYLVAVGITQFDQFDGQSARRGRIDDNGTDLSRHEHSPASATALKAHCAAAARQFLGGGRNSLVVVAVD